MQKSKGLAERFSLQASELCMIVLIYILLLCAGVVLYQNANVSAKTAVADASNDAVILVNTLPISVLQNDQLGIGTAKKQEPALSIHYMQNKDKLQGLTKAVTKKQKLWKAERERLRAIRREKRRLQRIRKQCGVKVDRKSQEILERIVEAEAGGEDLRGKLMVANVVLNRVKSERFPSTVKKVVFAHRQFSPLSDGRYWKVRVSAHTKKAVALALKGRNPSNGALYFMARKYASPSNVRWFDRALTKVASHGVHEFYK